VTCPYGFNGTGAVETTPDGVRWTVADPEAHATDEVSEWPLLKAKYEVVEPCSHWPGTNHVRLK
jgi:hypothetical protein